MFRRYNFFPDFPLSVMSRLTLVSQKNVEYLMAKLNKSNCKNDPVDVKLLYFEVVGNTSNDVFSDIINTSNQLCISKNRKVCLHPPSNMEN